MKNLYYAALLFISFNVSAQSKLPPMSELPPKHPVTNSTDRSKPGLVIDGDKAYQTHPGTKTRDYRKPGYVKDSSGILRPTHPVTNSTDRSKPGLVIDGDKAYQTHPGTKTRDYRKPGYVIDSSGSRILKPISKD